MLRFQGHRLTLANMPLGEEGTKDYRDPLAEDPKGQDYARRWLAQMQPVSVAGRNVGWAVIVQESYDSAIGATLAMLRSRLIGYGLAALAMIVFVLFGLWGLVFRLLNESMPLRARVEHGPVGPHTALPSTPSDPHTPTELSPRPRI